MGIENIVTQSFSILFGLLTLSIIVERLFEFLKNLFRPIGLTGKPMHFPELENEGSFIEEPTTLKPEDSSLLEYVENISPGTVIIQKKERTLNSNEISSVPVTSKY